jgi:hypothetical protein
MGAGRSLSGTSTEGAFAYAPISGDADMIVRVMELGREHDPAGDAELALTLRGSTEDFSPYALVSAVGNTADGNTPAAYFASRPGAARWGTVRRDGDKALRTRPGFLRIIRRGDLYAGYISANGQEWEEIWAVGLDIQAPLLAGLAVAGDGQARGVAACRLVPPDGPPLPIIRAEAKKKDSRWAELEAPVKLSISPAEGTTAEWALKGPGDSRGPATYHEPVELTAPGRYDVYARTVASDGSGAKTVLALTIVP